MNTNSNLVEDSPFAALIGLDWGDSQHALAILDCSSGKIESSTLEHSVENVQTWLKGLEKRFGSKPVAIALETSKGPLIHMFLGIPWLTVFPIHPATPTMNRVTWKRCASADPRYYSPHNTC